MVCGTLLNVEFLKNLVRVATVAGLRLAHFHDRSFPFLFSTASLLLIHERTLAGRPGSQRIVSSHLLDQPPKVFPGRLDCDVVTKDRSADSPHFFEVQARARLSLAQANLFQKPPSSHTRFYATSRMLCKIFLRSPHCRLLGPPLSLSGSSMPSHRSTLFARQSPRARSPSSCLTLLSR